MTLLTVCQDVCATVGVMRPSSIFGGLSTSRTQQELLALANEMAQRIAYDTRDWKRLSIYRFIPATAELDLPPVSNPLQSKLPLPSDFKRLLLTSNVRKSSVPTIPLQFVPDLDVWAERRLANRTPVYGGEWSIAQNCLFIVPKLASTDAVSFFFLQKNFINVPVGPGGAGGISEFAADTDVFSLDERLLKLGMVFQWKAQKGTPYAEDMGNYEDALARIAGADTPAPIIVGRKPISSTANVAFPWPQDWGSVTR